MNIPKKYFILFVIIIFGCSPNDRDLEEQNKRWFKGNLHTHSYWSDGDEFPEVIIDWYKSNDYHFVALSDHNILADGEKWVTIREDTIYQNAFKDYLETYGEEWINHRIDSGRIQVKLKTYDEYRSRYEEKGRFIIIQSEEITDRFENKPIHMNATNIQEKIDPQGGNSVSEVLQNNINQVIRQRERTGTPMIPHINHPNFGYGVSLDDIISLTGERFFEVYNGHPAVHNLGDSIHISTEEMWDLINIAYLQKNQPMMYGLATDDSHNYHVKNSKWSNAGRGWIVVQADTLTPGSLIEAMENGNFYASTGVALKRISFLDNKLEIEIDAEEGITYSISFIGYQQGSTSSKELKSVDGANASFELSDDIIFVRSKITSTKLQENPVEGMKYEMAWTQPMLRN